METTQTNGTNGSTLPIITLKGLRASAARTLGLGTMVSNGIPLSVEVAPDALPAITAEVKRVLSARRVKKGLVGVGAAFGAPHEPSLPNVTSLPDAYLAKCIGEVIARQERIRTEADERIAKLGALLKSSAS
jgi:hypothetical protein